MVIVVWCCLITLWYQIMKQKKLTGKPAVFKGIVLDKRIYRRNSSTSYVIKCLFNSDPDHLWNEKPAELIEGYMRSKFMDLYIPKDITNLIKLFYMSYDIKLDYFMSDSIVEVYDVKHEEFDSIEMGEDIDILCDREHPKLFNAPRFEVKKYQPKVEINTACATITVLWMAMLIFLPLILNGPYGVRLVDGALLFLTFNLFSCIIAFILCSIYKAMVTKCNQQEFKHQYQQISQIKKGHLHDNDVGINSSDSDSDDLSEGKSALKSVNIAITNYILD